MEKSQNANTHEALEIQFSFFEILSNGYTIQYIIILKMSRFL